MCLLDLSRTAVEGSALVVTRAALGDEKTAELVFGCDYDADFCRRHSHQLGGLMTSYLDAQTGT